MIAIRPFPLLALIGAVLLVCCGCTRISVRPQCPGSLEVGDSVELKANERSPGAIAEYLWEVFPGSAGSFEDAAEKDTTFEAEQAGEAVIRLTATDGLFQSVAECRVTIGESAGGGATVSLAADPEGGAVGEEFILTCTGDENVDAETLVITQTSGPITELVDDEAGMASFVPDVGGAYVFQCVGETDDGDETEPAEITVMVTRDSRPR